MRCRSIVSLTALIALVQSVTAQVCPQVPACPSTPADVPEPWFSLDFALDPRVLPNVGFDVSYNWLQQDNNADGCGQYHQGLLWLNGAPTGNPSNTNGPGPSVDIYATSGAYYAGATAPGNFGGPGRGFVELGTGGWSFEVTFKPYTTGAQSGWAKMYDLGTSRQLNGQSCDANALLTWNGGSNRIDFQTCTNGNEAKFTGLVGAASTNTWYHIIVTVAQSPVTGKALYTAYVNGNWVNQMFDTQYLVNTVRDRAYLGRSTWGDAFFNGTIDNFAIYDVVLNSRDVLGLYGAAMTGCAVNRIPINGTNPQSTTSVPPIPHFETNFSSNITQAPVVPADFSWVTADANDLACGITHHDGLLLLHGDANFQPSYSEGQYVNLTATDGENYAGVTLPPFGGVTPGQGAYQNFTAGFSIEVTVKARFQQYLAKIFSLGNTNTGTCTAGDIWAGWYNGALSLQVAICKASGQIVNVFNNIGPFKLQTWYHIVISVIAETGGLSTFTLYLNGQLVAVANAQYMVPFMQRRNQVLGRSNFFVSQDTYWSGYIDKFAIYPQALTKYQVQPLAAMALYNNANATSGVSTCPQLPNQAGDITNLPVFYNISWPTDPRPVNVTKNYAWIPYFVNDSAIDQTLFTGVVTLGTSVRNTGQWVDLNAASGATSSSNLTLGKFGGIGTGNYTNSTMGWTFEIVFKIIPTVDSSFDGSGNFNRNGMDWAKIFDFGDGNTARGCENDMIFGFNSGDNWMKFQTCNTVGETQDLGANTKRAMRPNKWYHALISLQLVPDGSFAQFWLNNELIETRTFNGYPVYASRINAQMGKSSWGGDKYFNGHVTRFALYSQAVNPQQATALYRRVVPAGSYPASSSSSSSTAVSTAQSAVSSSVRAISSSSTGPNENGAATLASTYLGLLSIFIGMVLLA